jgi:hypothetical protein
VFGLVKALFRVVLGDSSSVNIRREGVQVSSNWPDLTAQIKAARKARAKVKLMKMSRKTTSMA